MTPRGTLATNQAIPAVEACAAGLGFGRFLAYQVEPWVRSGRLRIVLQAFEPSPVPVSLAYAETRLMTPRLRVLLDFMKQCLRAALNCSRDDRGCCRSLAASASFDPGLNYYLLLHCTMQGTVQPLPLVVVFGQTPCLAFFLGDAHEKVQARPFFYVFLTVLGAALIGHEWLLP